MTDWKPGTPIAAPFSSMTTVDPAALSVKDLYKVMIGAIVPRPIAFVSTLNAEGEGNLAPFSFFNGVSTNPPCLMVSIVRKPDGSKKDTLRNIEATGEFVVNTVSEWIHPPVVYCGAEYPYGVNEMDKVGLTPIPSVEVRPPRVKESPVHFECRTHQTVEIGDGGAGSVTLVIGRIVRMHLADSVYREGRISHAALRPVARLGGHHYTKLGEIVELAIPKPLP